MFYIISGTKDDVTDAKGNLTGYTATIISAMGQQAGGYVAISTLMQMMGMNVASMRTGASPEPKEEVKEEVENYQRIIWSCLIRRWMMEHLLHCLPCLRIMRKIRLKKSQSI